MKSPAVSGFPLFGVSQSITRRSGTLPDSRLRLNSERLLKKLTLQESENGSGCCSSMNGSRERTKTRRCSVSVVPETSAFHLCSMFIVLFSPALFESAIEWQIVSLLRNKLLSHCNV